MSDSLIDAVQGWLDAIEKRIEQKPEQDLKHTRAFLKYVFEVDKYGKIKARRKV